MLTIGIGTYIVYDKVLNKNIADKEDNKDVENNNNNIKTIGNYICKNSECDFVVGENDIGNFRISDIVKIRDGSDILLINQKTGEILYDTYRFYYYIYDYNGDYESSPVVAFAYLTNDMKYGFIDNNGNKIIEPYYDVFLPNAPFLASGKSMLITVRKDNKWGIFSLESGKEVIPTMYDEIHTFNSNNFSIKINDTWSVYNLESYEKDKATGSNYQTVYIYENYYLAAKNDLLNLYNGDGEMIGNVNIPLGLSYHHMACCGNLSGIYFEYTKDSENQLSIAVDYNDGTDNNRIDRIDKYIFDLVTKELIDELS